MTPAEMIIARRRECDMATILARSWSGHCQPLDDLVSFLPVRLLLSVLLAIVLAGVIGVGGAVPAAANPDLRIEADVTYELQPEDERVRVSVDVRLTNLRPDRGLTYYYFDQIGFPVPSEATNVQAQRVGGATLSTSMERLDDPLWSGLNVRLSPVLRYGSPQRIQLRYDLPSLPPRSDGWTRASPAYTLFPVYPVGDPQHASITVIVPDVFDDVHVGGSEMKLSRADGEMRYAATTIDSEDWWAVVSARNDSLLEEREFRAGDHRVRLRFWPGDDEWADFVEDIVIEGIPVLEELIGLPWPNSDDELEIIESSAPHAYGYGGWYDHAENQIEVGDELDALLVMHELSHAWFNGETIADLWLREGLAELYAYQSVVAMDGYEPDRKPERSSAKETVPLAAWTQRVFDHNELDHYGYAMSWWVFNELYDDVGQEGMSEVLAAVFDRQIPYAAGGEREDTVGDIDWMRMLDLLDEIGGSEHAVDLYEELVVAADDLVLLEERIEARDAYSTLVASAGGWDAPLELRRAMTIWRFDRVEELVASSEQVLTHRDEILAGLAPLGVADLPALESAYQSETRIVDSLGIAEEYLDVVGVIVEAQERPDGPLGLFAQLGMLAAGSEGELVTAAEHLSEGEIAEAALISDQVFRDAQQSTIIGAVLAGQVVLCLILLPIAASKRRRTRRSAGRRAVGSDAWPTEEPSSSPSIP
jgi:hypothetical protein